jgi:hypothetical protein
MTDVKLDTITIDEVAAEPFQANRIICGTSPITTGVITGAFHDSDDEPGILLRVVTTFDCLNAEIPVDMKDDGVYQLTGSGILEVSADQVLDSSQARLLATFLIQLADIADARAPGGKP